MQSARALHDAELRVVDPNMVRAISSEPKADDRKIANEHDQQVPASLVFC